jgi:hypothetical protein
LDNSVDRERLRLGNDFELDLRPSRYDSGLLQAIRQQLTETHERGMTADKILRTVEWMRARRRELDEAHLHDATNWLTVAEAILVSASVREESRGFFVRDDFAEMNPRLDRVASVVGALGGCGDVSGEMISWDGMARRIAGVGSAVNASMTERAYAEVF